ncbi:hypothetical protein Salat_2539900 [Sesamum alatum]|uniref:Uncharacterized protein n=1 Tax=Sesamum alatum TaxID=300844 RepID=A0AAE1XS89_9LAMI|nr:hypothetical protein Salat_2539900 [Sesamum alatum]
MFPALLTHTPIPVTSGVAHSSCSYNMPSCPHIYWGPLWPATAIYWAILWEPPHHPLCQFGFYPISSITSYSTLPLIFQILNNVSRLSTYATTRDSNTHSHPFRCHGETLPSSCLLFLIYVIVLRGPSGNEPTVCIVGPLFVLIGSLVSLLLLHHGAPPLFDGGMDPLHSPWIRQLLSSA